MAPENMTKRILRLILFLSDSNIKSKDECASFPGIRDSEFNNYRNTLKSIGFEMHQKDGKYWINTQKKRPVKAALNVFTTE